MKSVLMIAYQFPPMGGSGVQRTTKFVKYLPDFGWNPVVLTRSIDRMKLRDSSLLSEIPDGTRIIRTRSYDLTELPGILELPGKFAARKILIPDGEIIWARFAKKEAEKEIDKGSIDLIYTTSYPYSDHLLGLALKKKYNGIPWVADFRDEWTNNPYLLDNPHNRIRMKIERKMEDMVLQAADMLITNTPVMLENFLKRDPSLKKKFHVIPNGFDREDFIGLTPVRPGEKKLVFTYTGLLYGRRKPDTFFKALSSLIESGTVQKEHICVKFIGNYKEHVMNETINRFNLNGVVNVYPYMEHKECLNHLAGSDILLLIEGSGPGAEAFYTGKVFEYMNIGRPILAVIPKNGAAASLIRETSTGYVCDFDDIDEIAKCIQIIYNEWKNGYISYNPDSDEIAKYERKNLCEKLAGVFEKALA